MNEITAAAQGILQTVASGFTLSTLASIVVYGIACCCSDASGAHALKGPPRSPGEGSLGKGKSCEIEFHSEWNGSGEQGTSVPRVHDRP